MKRTSTLFTAIALALMVGCGSGNGLVTNPTSDASQAFTFGEIAGRAVLSAPPQTVETRQTTVTSLVGVISDMSMTGGASPTLSSTRIAFHRGEGGIYENQQSKKTKNCKKEDN